MERLRFHFTLNLLSDVSGILKAVATALQKPGIDLVECCTRIRFLRSELLAYKESDPFEKLFKEAALSKLYYNFGLTTTTSTCNFFLFGFRFDADSMSQCSCTRRLW